MRHTRSSAEVEIRDQVVTWVREHRPGHRIVHEMNVNGQGSHRADVAAIGAEELILFEIKSERDVLKRVEHQYWSFQACAHTAIVVAHRKWFEDKVTPNSAAIRFLQPTEPLQFLRHTGALWAYPEPGPEFGWADGKWQLDRIYHPGLPQPQPNASRFLATLWASELRAECRRHRIAVNDRSTMTNIVRDMVWLLSGREICQAVCRQLRGREFAEADPPIVDGGAG